MNKRVVITGLVLLPEWVGLDTFTHAIKMEFQGLSTTSWNDTVFMSNGWKPAISTELALYFLN
jgi:hypothetical protein